MTSLCFDIQYPDVLMYDLMMFLMQDDIVQKVKQEIEVEKNKELDKMKQSLIKVHRSSHLKHPKHLKQRYQFTEKINLQMDKLDCLRTFFLNTKALDNNFKLC